MLKIAKNLKLPDEAVTQTFAILAKSILKVLINAYPDGLSRDAITEATGYMRSSRNTYLSRMTAREIIEVNGQEVRASDNLFAGVA